MHPPKLQSLQVQGGSSRLPLQWQPYRWARLVEELAVTLEGWSETAAVGASEGSGWAAGGTGGPCAFGRLSAVSSQLSDET